VNDGQGGVWDVLLILALLFGAAILLGWLSGRILGVRRGFLRSVAAGVVGFLGGLLLIDLQEGEHLTEALDVNAEDTDWGLFFEFLLGFLGYTLIITLLASLVIAAILRPRRRRGWRMPHPIRAIRDRIAVLARFRDIAAAARRNGLVGPHLASRSGLATPEGARALRKTLEESGGMLVKFGQIASTREDLLPPVITDELAELRTSVPGLPPEVVEGVIQEELGSPVSSLFAEFDDEPLAAASIGVTHRAVLHDGRRVIVKVQRPGVEENVRRDGRVLLWAARQLSARSESARAMGLNDLAEELVEGITDELDFTMEAANNAAMRQARADDVGIRFPEIFPDLTTRRVLVMEEVDGDPVSDAIAVADTGVPPRVIDDRIMDSFLGQVLEDGVYHADPHPGNLLIAPDGTVSFIDYGAVGHIDPVTLEGLQQLALGFAMRDPAVLARGVRRIAGRAGESIDIASLEFDIGTVLTDTQGGGFDPRALSEIIRVLNRHGVGAPRSLTILARAVLTLDGTMRMLDPEYRMGPAAQARMGKIVADSELNPRDQLTRELARSLPALKSLPQIGEDVALQARAGRFTIRVDRFEGPDGQRVESWLNRILFTSIGVMGLLGSAVVLVAAGLPSNDDVGNALRIVGLVGLGLSSVMLMRVVAQILNDRDPDDPL